MSTTDSNKIISLTVTKFPQNLLIPSADNIVSLKVISSSNKKEKFKISFEGENLEISCLSEECKNEIEFGPRETKDIELRLKPTADGSGKLIINIYWLKVVQYTEKVQKIRDVVSSSKITKILRKKQLPIKDSDQIFNHKEYFIAVSKSEIKNTEKEIKTMKVRYEILKDSDQSQLGFETKSLEFDVIKKDLNNQTKILAKQYLAANEFFKALETALELSDETEKINFYYDLIRAYASVNLDETLNVVKSLRDENKRIECLGKLAIDYVNKNHDQIIKILTLIDNPLKKEEIVTNAIGKAIKNDPQLALKLTYFIKDEVSKVKVLFNVMKKFHDDKNRPEIMRIVNQINQIILNSPTIKLSNANFQNPAYEFFKEAICILAEIDCPQAVDTIISGINEQEIRERIAKDLFNEIYIIVDELRTKIESTIVYSQYYVLNIFSSKYINEIQNFSLIGGNVSSNLLSKDYNVKVILLSLFSYDFGIFPIIDRIYSDLKFNSKKSIGYYIYPSIKHHDEEELKVIQNTLRLFIPANKISNQIYLFNLDFIPYLGKPTIILASDSEDLDQLKVKVNRKLGNKVQVLIDNSFFEGGQTFTNLKTIFTSYNFKLINLILSYEFLNDYNTFKAFVESII